MISLRRSVIYSDQTRIWNNFHSILFYCWLFDSSQMYFSSYLGMREFLDICFFLSTELKSDKMLFLHFQIFKFSLDRFNRFVCVFSLLLLYVLSQTQHYYQNSFIWQSQFMIVYHWNGWRIPHFCGWTMTVFRLIRISLSFCQHFIAFCEIWLSKKRNIYEFDWLV